MKLIMAPFLLLLLIYFIIPCSFSLPLCTDSRAPVVPKSPLSFCGYNGSSCCNLTDDLALRKQFMGMNISDLACGSVVKSILCAETYEEVDLITKGGNYGWRVYEGPELFNASWTPGGNTSVKSIDAISPVMGYLHSSVNNKIGSASIIGGYVYRSTTDPCTFGRYLYSDLYAAIMWAGIESPENSGNYSTAPIPFTCAKDSPIPCDTVAGSPLPSLGYIYSYGEDNTKDVYILASQGLYRVVRPSRCNYVCSKETNANNGNSPPGPSSAPQMNILREVVILIFALSVLLIG